MAGNFKARRKTIHEATIDGKLRSKIRILRDLQNRKKQKGLNVTEKNSLERIKHQILEEWAVSMSIEVDDARKKLNHLLRQDLIAI